MSHLDPYVKSIMGLSGAILTALAAFYGGTHWYPIAVAVVTAVNVYLAKNTPKGAVWVKPDTFREKFTAEARRLHR